jgi:prepilin-type N-terminal cleavage/methylation domain-containing protein
MMQRRAARVRTHRDAGMTLPEVLVSMAITGVLVAAMAMAATLVIRQADNNTGRVNNVRSEQSVGIWLPSDLASAESVNTDPAATPCGTACPPGLLGDGSNALMLTWSGSVPGVTASIPTTTTVSYRYVLSGTEYQIVRVICDSIGGAAPTCSQVTMLHDVLAPPAGQIWTPGVTSPTWVMLVRLALNPADTTNGNSTVVDPTYQTKNGRRVTVTINGGGDVAAGGGGQDVITFSAGGTNRQPDLSTSNLSDAPTFSATRSRCGGNFGMVVDTSGSIGSTNMASVRSGITAFVNAFAGTPIKLQIVRFSTNATTLGAGSGWSRYYDMLVDSDIADLKTQVGTLTSTGTTNYEDAMFRMFNNKDGTVQSTLPDTMIFFTDGIPNYSRLDSTTATAAAVANPADAALPTSTGGSFSQVAFNRANRIVRQYDPDVQRLIGVFVGVDTTGTSTWITAGAGYHLTNFGQGFHNLYEQGYNLSNVVRGYHGDYQYATTGINYQYNSANVYQYNQTGFSPQSKSGSTWSNTTWATYLSGITGGQPTKYQVVVNAAATGGWATMTKAQFDARTLGAAAPAAAFRVTGATSGTWTNINTGSSASAIATARTYYLQYNTTAANTDGFRITNSSTPGGWTSTTVADYNLSDITANDGGASDVNDGYQYVKLYSSPYSSWDPTTDALYMANNVSAGTADGWDATTNYSAPFTYWATTTLALYTAGNTTADATDGWRVTPIYSAPYDFWLPITEATYNSKNTVWGSSDGWDATKVYSLPFTYYEPNVSSTVNNTDILAKLITVGNPVPAIPTGGPYTNAAVADMYVLPNWSQFAGALNGVALAECGGTVTVQTRVGTAAAADPFTYQNSVDLKVATTSSLYRSGTFDYDLSGGKAVAASITPLNLSSLSKYTPVSWSCKSAGADYPFTTTALSGSVWSKINLSVGPNEAISCIQTVALK